MLVVLVVFLKDIYSMWKKISVLATIFIDRGICCDLEKYVSEDCLMFHFEVSFPVNSWKTFKGLYALASQANMFPKSFSKTHFFNK